MLCVHVLFKFTPLPLCHHFTNNVAVLGAGSTMLVFIK